ncbi:MAG TPA: disulfide oxidoreductase [Herpetosiphonaceae bacterium]
MGTSHVRASADPADGRRHQSSHIGAFVRRTSVYVAWLQAMVATLGSLYFSEIRQFPPCSLCWYQRILMYPLTVILTVGILRRDPALRWYALPLSVGGLLVATYHCLLTYNVIAAELAPCMQGVSCLTRWINWFGFITIPLLAWVAFLVITLTVSVAMLSEEDLNETTDDAA